MEDFSDFITFHIQSDRVYLLSIEADYGKCVVAEIGTRYCYLGDVELDVYAAISAWEMIFNQELKDLEIEQNVQTNS